MTQKNELLSFISEVQTTEEFQKLHWKGSFTDYLELIIENPEIVCSAFQRLYNMILHHGMEEYTDSKKKIVHYKFFEDNGGQDAVYGLDIPLMNLISFLKSAASCYGAEKRILLLHGPVGSAKSTIARLLKKGLEEFSRTNKGTVYTFEWLNLDEGNMPCPMNEEPLHLFPQNVRNTFLSKYVSNDTTVSGDLCPACRYNLSKLSEKYNGDFNKIISDHIQVKRFLFSEKDRIGIGTFQPKDEKNQDSTELTGDINYRKIAIYGVDSDPRAFSFDGEFNIANRGLIEFIEVLKLDVAFLYDLLGASQEHSIKPKKFAQTDIDEVILAHTNGPEYRKLQNNEFMEALRDRTIKIDIPYNTRLKDEIKIYERDFNSKRIKSKHIAPHSLEMAAMWAVLTRLTDPKKANLSLLQKLKLYDGKTLPGFTEDSVRELRKETEKEGMEGISPRYIQDKISNTLVGSKDEGCINPFLILNELESGLKSHSLISSEDQRVKYTNLLGIVKEEYENIVKTEVQKAICADDDTLKKLCGNYIDNVKAYTQKEKVKNKFTGQDEDPDEKLMRSIEEKIDIPDSRKDDFRREIMNYIGALALEGKIFDFKANERLLKALELKLFEDQKDSIKLTSLVSSVVDKETQEKIDIVKARLVKDYDYCDVCATDILSFVASIFARGVVKK